MMAAQYYVLKSSIFDLFQKAQSKEAFLISFNCLQNNDSKVDASLKKTINEGDYTS